MPAVLIGSPSSGKKVLRRADFSTERNGLETLNEIYTVRTADRVTLSPNFGDLHKDYSTAATKFTRMAVENFSFTEQDGDLTQINVTYVGLTTTSGLPPAIVRLLPIPLAGIYGPPMVIQAEFLTDKPESSFSVSGAGGAIISVGILPPFDTAIAMPPSINGTIMPSNPRPPFQESSGVYILKYYGYIQQSIACVRRGLFLVATCTFQEARTVLS
jgi:hypothetical protein